MLALLLISSLLLTIHAFNMKSLQIKISPFKQRYTAHRPLARIHKSSSASIEKIFSTISSVFALVMEEIRPVSMLSTSPVLP